MWNNISKRRGKQKGASFSHRTTLNVLDSTDLDTKHKTGKSSVTERVHGRFFASSKYLGHIKSTSPLTQNKNCNTKSSAKHKSKKKVVKWNETFNKLAFQHQEFWNSIQATQLQEYWQKMHVCPQQHHFMIKLSSWIYITYVTRVKTSRISNLESIFLSI